MLIPKILEGTCIFLTRKHKCNMYIQPGKTIIEDNLYVAYDVRVDGITAIPKGTRVIGDWVTTFEPEIGAQLRIHWIFLSGSGQEIQGDSDVFRKLSFYDSREVAKIPFMDKTKKCKSVANIVRRSATVGLHSKTLLDNRCDLTYIEIDAREIPVYLTRDFLAYMSFTGEDIKRELKK
jgi:hypothetical protein